MSSILNSISSGDLQVLVTPRETPVKKDSIIELLQNSEIEFETCPKLENNNLNNFNTGFGGDNDLHYETPCKSVELKTPLYQENFLKEFVTEEEKAAARHALGLYNKGDVVAMSLLTAEDETPSKLDLVQAPVKQLQKGAAFFTPITTVHAVYDSQGVTLDVTLNTLQQSVVEHQKQLNQILQVSTSGEISSLGDVKVFLQGFNNGDSLYETLDEMNQEMVRFEKTGQITE